MSASLTGGPLHAFGGKVPDPHALIQHQLADVDGDVLGYVARQHFDLDLAIHEVDDATLLLDALGLALEDDRDRDRQHLVHRDLIEVGMEQLVVDRVELILLDQHPRVAAGVGQPLETDERVDARFRVQDLQQRLRIDGDLERLPLLGAVEHGRDASARAQPARLVLASGLTLLELQCCSGHKLAFSYQLSALNEPKAYVVSEPAILPVPFRLTAES